MKKISISLEEGKTHKKVGLAIYGYEDMRKVINIIEESLKQNFRGAEIVRQRAVRELFGE